MHVHFPIKSIGFCYSFQVCTLHSILFHYIFVGTYVHESRYRTFTPSICQLQLLYLSLGSFTKRQLDVLHCFRFFWSYFCLSLHNPESKATKEEITSREPKSTQVTNASSRFYKFDNTEVHKHSLTSV